MGVGLGVGVGVGVSVGVGFIVAVGVGVIWVVAEGYVGVGDIDGVFAGDETAYTINPKRSKMIAKTTDNHFLSESFSFKNFLNAGNGKKKIAAGRKNIRLTTIIPSESEAQKPEILKPKSIH